MTAMQPTPEEAAGALAEARLRESQVHKADTQLGWILGVLAAAVIGIGCLMSVAPYAAGPAVAAIYLAAIAGAAFVLLRIRAYSRLGLLVFTFAASTFAIWDALGAAVSVTTGWWSRSQPSFHFGVTEVIAVVPLLVGIGLLSRKRR